MLQKLISEHLPDIICLQETHFHEHKTHTPKHYNGFFKNRNRTTASGGVAIFTRSTIVAEKINITTNIEAVAIKIKAPTEINICNLYLPPNIHADPKELDALFKQIPSPRLIIGDFNGHNIAWGSRSNDSRGKQLYETFNCANLAILNDGSGTRFNITAGTSSAIDLSLCTPNLLPQLSWQINKDLYDSDHFPITITNTTKRSHDTIPLQRWRLNKANWTDFSQHIDDNIHLAKLQDDITATVEDFNKIIIDAAYHAIGKTAHIKKYNAVPWWNEECESAIKASKQSLNKYKRYKTPENCIEYKKKRAFARLTIKHNKRRSWHQYVQKINSSTPITNVWKKIKSIAGKSSHMEIAALQKNDLSMITDNNEIAEELANAYCLHSKNDNYDPDFLVFKQKQEKNTIMIHENADPINTPISLHEFNDALHELKNTSPGPDDIPPIFLKNLPSSAKHHLLQIYNSVWSQHLYPNTWRKAITIPILKPSKSPLLADSYRPISLTSALCKLLEKIINKRLLWDLESKGHLSPEQSGFRPNRSTLDNIIDLETHIKEAFSNKEHCMAIYFDVNKAFETTWKHNILSKLSNLGYQVTF